MYIVLGNNYTECYNATDAQKKNKVIYVSIQMVLVLYHLFEILISFIVNN